MTGQITIGEFATMTRLSRKALRYYHDLGLLEPAQIDPANGYRYYDSSQIELARIIRRFRDLNMPVPDLKAYVCAADEPARAAILSAHLDRLHAELWETQQAIDALRELLTPHTPAPAIELQNIDAEIGWRISEVVDLATVVDWWMAATRELSDGLQRAGVKPAGELRASFGHELFADERGEASVWFPIERSMPPTGRAVSAEVAGGRFAVAIHPGPDARIDETYALLGRYVTEQGIGTTGPVRERYLAGVLDDPAPLVTEIAWPIAG